MSLDVQFSSVRVANTTILKNVHLSVSGKVALLAPNGSGKSTLLKAIAGVPGVEADGNVTLDGTDLTHLTLEQRFRAGIAILFQHRIDLDMKVSTLFKSMGLTSQPLLQFFTPQHAQHVWNSNIKRLSGGEWRIVDLALTTAHKPRCYLLDEVEAGVDIENLEKIAQFFRTTDACAVIVTHLPTVIDLFQPTHVYTIKDQTLLRQR